jgi:DNA-binding NarL/FixJ family response regulator
MASAASEKERRSVRGADGRRPAGVVVIADDDAEARAHLATALRGAGFATAEVATGHEVLDQAREERPAAVVLEVSLPGLSGYSVCRRLREELGDDLPIVFVSGHRTEPHDRVAGFLVGADEYLAKPVTAEELIIRISRLVRRSDGRPRAGPPLSPRELEILGFLARGLGQKEIARELYVSPKTVGTHVEHIYRKLGVRSRAQAVAAALRDGLVEAS